MKKLASLLLMSILVVTTISAQQRKCASHDILLQKLEADPTLEQKMNAIERQTEAYSLNPTDGRVVYTIPVVVHVVYRNTTENISDAQVQSQITVLNKDFRKTNSDANLIPADFAGVAADAEFEFCLAKTDKNGNTFNGINRVSSTRSTDWGTNDAVKSAVPGWDPNKYLNIWVCSIGGGILGYATFPGTASATTDGVVIDYRYYGTTGTATAPFNLGRTATHEIGHWLNLRHIWGDATCGNDQVSDTPTHNTSNYGCPSQPHYSTCTGAPREMTMNYMDYTDDNCMYMFSAGQKTRMRALFATGGTRVALLSSTTCNTGSTSSCATPTGLAISNIANTSATASWGAVSGASGYTLTYGATSVNVTTTSYNMTGLTAGTSYSVTVKANCSSASSSTASTSFTTTGGTTTTCSDNYEANETISAAKTIAVNTNITARIGSATDVDWFKFANTTTNKKIRVTLTNLPFDYDVYLYNSSGSLKGKSENANTTSETIVFNTNTVGTYYIKVVGYNGVYSTSSCYTLKAEIRSTNYREGAAEFDDFNQVKQMVVAPNPVSDMATVNLSLGTVSPVKVAVYSIAGQEMLAQTQVISKENSTVQLDLSQLNSGMYIVVAHTAEGVLTEKIMVSRR
jgi:hypothetical protein